MKKNQNIAKQTAVRVFAFTALMFSGISSATVIQFETNFGNFDVNLYDQTTPVTVANFLAYINAGDYSNSIVHRSEPGFVIQGGGFAFANTWPATAIAANPAVTNEPVYSNVRGTIAMAKLGGNPNSATNQWFINIVDNSQALDPQNGGFTVFGQVVNGGMAIIDQINNLPRYNQGGAFTSIPLQNFDVANTPDATNLVIISSVQIIDTDTNSEAGLNKPLTTFTPSVPSSSGGGGSFGFSLIMLLGFLRKRQ